MTKHAIIKGADATPNKGGRPKDARLIALDKLANDEIDAGTFTNARHAAWHLAPQYRLNWAQYDEDVQDSVFHWIIDRIERYRAEQPTE